MSCFVNKNIAGIDNASSLLNEELKTIFPFDLGPNNASVHYLGLKQKGGVYKNSFPVDWETKEGQEYINKNHPGFLGEQGEPKLFVDKVGRAYFKTPGTNFYVNESTISEGERNENIKAIMASYVENPFTDLKSFIKDSAIKNINELDSILNKTEENLEKLYVLAEKDGISEKELKEAFLRASYLENDIEQINKSLTFLVSVSENEELQKILYHDVKLALEGAKIAYEDDVAEREKDAAEYSMGFEFLRPSNETNPLNSLAPEILKLMSTIPKTELKFDENGEISGHEKSASELMPLLTYIHDYNDVVKEVQKVLNNTVSIDLKFAPKDVKTLGIKKTREKYAEEIRKANLFDTMYDNLSKYAQENNSPKIISVLLKLDALIDSKKSIQDKEDIKAKFVKSFHKAKSNNIMHTSNKSELRFGPNAGSEMININRIDLSDEITRKDEFCGEVVAKAFMSLGSVKSKADTEKMNKAIVALYSPTSFYEEKENLKIYLETRYGMTLQDKTVSQLIYHINKGPAASKDKTKIIEFLNNMNQMNALGYNQSRIITKGKKNKKVNYTLSNLAKDYAKADYADKEIIINNFVKNGGDNTEFRIISDLEYKNNPTSADSSIAVGSKKVWMYSFMSKMHKDILTWKAGDTTTLEDLRNTGNGMVDFLLGKEEEGYYNKELSQKRIAKINLNNHMELRKKMDKNPEVFDSLTEEDLLLLTFTNLYENRKEKYVERQQGGTSMTGKNVDLQAMLDEAETANEVTFLNNSDKSRTIGFSGVLLGESDVEVDEDGMISSIGLKNIKRLRSIFEGELKKISDASDSIIEYRQMPDSTDKQKENKLSFSLRNLIPGWHYNDKSINTEDKNSIIPEAAFFDGNYRKFGFMNGFYNANKRKIDGRYFVDNKQKDVLWANRELDNNNFDLDLAIDDYFSEVLQKEKDELVAMTGASEKEDFTGTTPRKGLFEIQTSVIHENVEINQHKTGADFLMNYMFHSIDLFNIFNGEIGMYKQKGNEFNMMDALKRTSAVNADGIYANNPDPLLIDKYIPHGNGKPIEYFKNTKTIFAVVKAQKYPQSYYGPIINKLISENDKGNYITLKGEVADGASYGHPDFLFDFYRRTYGVSKEEEKLHSELMNSETIPTEEHFKFLKKLGGSNQPGKLQAFSILRKKDGTRMPFFWKSSVFPLYPSLTKGFQIDKLRAQMVKQNINIVGNDSAFKSTTHAATTLFAKTSDNGVLGLINENIDLNPFEVNTWDLKIQVELSAKGDKEDTVAGSQPLRNITANINLKSNEQSYNYKGKAITGKEMQLVYDNNIKENIQRKVDYFLNKINYKNENDFDETIFRKMFTAQLPDVDFDLKEIIENIDMPLETIPGMGNRLYPILTSYIEKNVAKPSTNGTAAIQVPNSGFNDLSVEDQANSILFNKNHQLRPPRPTSFQDFKERILKTEGGEEKIEFMLGVIKANNENPNNKYFDLEQSPLYFSKENPDLISLTKQDGYYASIEAGEIMIPFSSLFKNSKMTWKEFQEFAKQRDELGNLVGIDEKVLETLLGYRIPNQSVSSNDAFKVVGILPPSVGDSAIIYHEITAKTGSDFDIDKMVLMLPNFSTVYERVDNSKLSKTNINAIDESEKNNPVSKFMETDVYDSANQVYAILFRNEKMLDAAAYHDFYNKNREERIDFFIENRKDIERILEKDHSKASNKPNYEFSVRDVMKDLYKAIEARENVIDAELKEKGFGKRKRLVASRFEYISDNSEKGLQNNLIESMISILKSSKTFDDLISPLDGTHIKDSINEIRLEYALAETGGKRVLDEARMTIEDEKQKVANGEMKFDDSMVGKFLKEHEKSLVASMMPKFLASSRTDMLMAKQLTATMANHMTNIPLTQLNEVFLKYNIGLESSSLARTHIIGKEDQDDFKITKMVSYLMNASVDAAKDNYIILGNYNRYTSGAAMLFVRLGIDPKDAAKILQHPLLLKLSKEKLGSKSKIANISASKTNSELDEFAGKIAEKINGGLKINPEAFIANIYESKEKIPAKDKIGLSDEDILGFWHLSVSIGKDLSAVIKTSKPETGPKTIYETHVMSNMLEKLEGNSFAALNEEKEQIGGGLVFKEKVNGIPEFDPNVLTTYDNRNNYMSGVKGSYVESIHNAMYSLTEALTKGKLIERTPGYTELLNRILINLGQGHSVNEDKIKSISSMLYPYVLSTSGNDLYNFIQDKDSGIDDIKDMLDTLPKDLLLIKANPKYYDNLFLKEIRVDEAKGFISFDNVANYTTATKVAIKDAAISLYNNRETRELMSRMAKYSFFTTGFRSSSYSFANYMPKGFFTDIKHDESIKNLLNRLNDKDSYADHHLEKAMMFLASNRPEDDTINKILKGKNVQIISGIPIKNENTVKKLMYKDPDTKEMHFYPFVAVNKKTGIVNYALVNIEKAKKEGQPDQPTYEAINVMQYQASGDFNRDYDEENEDEDYEETSVLGEKRTIDKKKRSSRLLLFDPNLASSEFLFRDNKNSRLELRRTNNNVHQYNNRVLFELEKSEESLNGLKMRNGYLSGLKSSKLPTNHSSEIKEMTSNKETYLALSNIDSINIKEIAEYQKIIDYFYSQDKDADFKQKAQNELDRLKGCSK